MMNDTSGTYALEAGCLHDSFKRYGFEACRLHESDECARWFLKLDACMTPVVRHVKSMLA